MLLPSLPPTAPRLLPHVLGRVPVAVHSEVLARVCNRLFQTALHSGELEFLRGRTLEIRVRDLRWCCRISLDDRGLCRATAPHADVTITGDWAEFLLLASRREDPDTLFFSRRLHLQGDTELGLQVKNFLDAQEPPAALLGLLQRLSDQLLPSASAP